MASPIRLNLNPSPLDLRRFGYLLVGVCGLVATYFTLDGLWSGHLSWTVPLWCLGIAVVIGVPSMLAWRIAAPFQIAWIALGIGLNYVMMRVIVGLVLYLVITPIGLVLRWRGHDALALRGDRSSTWTPIRHKVEPASYERQS